MSNMLQCNFLPADDSWSIGQGRLLDVSKHKSVNSTHSCISKSKYTAALLSSAVLYG